MKLVSLAASLAAVFTFNASAHAGPIAAGKDITEIAGMQLLYEFNVAGINTSTTPSYTVNNLASVMAQYSRVGYYVEVTSGVQAGQWIYVSMNSFDSNAARLALPHHIDNRIARQTVVSNVNVYSNNAGITQGTGMGSFGIEMWPSNYSEGKTGYTTAGSANRYDVNDTGYNATSRGYGSFQVHNLATNQTLFAWNNFMGSQPNRGSDFGIGNASLVNAGFTHNDWTFSNAGQAGRIQILVGNPVPEPASLGLLGLGLAALGIARRRKPAR